MDGSVKDEVNHRIDDGKKGGWCIEAFVETKNIIHSYVGVKHEIPMLHQGGGWRQWRYCIRGQFVVWRSGGVGLLKVLSRLLRRGC